MSGRAFWIVEWPGRWNPLCNLLGHKFHPHLYGTMKTCRRCSRALYVAHEEELTGAEVVDHEIPRSAAGGEAVTPERGNGHPER